MNRLIKYTCTNSTYINNKKPDSIFYNNEYLLAGLQKEHTNKPEINISLFTFPSIKINYDNIINAHLFINLKDTKLHTNPDNNKVHILGNYDYLNFPELTYNNFRISGLCGECYEKVNLMSNSLIKIDVTNIIKDLSKYGFNTNIFFIPDNECYFCFNIDHKHSPYISIEIAESAEIIKSAVNINTPKKTSFKKTTSNKVQKKSIYKFISNINTSLLSLSETVNKINQRLTAIENAANSHEIALNQKIEDSSALITSNNSDVISEYNNKLDDFFKSTSTALSSLNMQFNSLSEYIHEDSANINSSLTKSIKKIDEMLFNHNNLSSYISNQFENLNHNYTNMSTTINDYASNLKSAIENMSAVNTQLSNNFNSLGKSAQKSNTMLNNSLKMNSNIASSLNDINHKLCNLDDINNILACFNKFEAELSELNKYLSDKNTPLKFDLENSKEIKNINDQLLELNTLVSKLLDDFNTITIEPF